jgi:thiol-disulfide isomerase/thioredoxin
MAFSSKPSQQSKQPDRRFWTPGRVALSIVALCLTTAIGLSSCNSSDQPGVAGSNSPAGTASPGAKPAANNPAPAAFVPLPAGLRDTKLQTLDGESLKLSDYDNKVLVVNLWATWCGPCRKEMAELVKMSGEYKARGLVVLGLATTYNEQDDPQRVKDYVRNQKIPYKIIWDDGTLAAPMVEAVRGRQVIPQSFVISRDGRIVKHFTGFSELSTPQLMRQAIEDALNDKGKA